MKKGGKLPPVMPALLYQHSEDGRQIGLLIRLPSRREGERCGQGVNVLCGNIPVRPAHARLPSPFAAIISNGRRQRQG